jgi:hypothetical protein
VNLEFFVLPDSNLGIRKVSLIFFGTSYFFKLTFNKDVVSYTKVVLLTKTSFIGDRFNILLSVHQVVRMFLGGARRHEVSYGTLRSK